MVKEMIAGQAGMQVVYVYDSRLGARIAGYIAMAISTVAVIACLLFLPTLIFKVQHIKQQLQLDTQEFDILADSNTRLRLKPSPWLHRYLKKL